AQNTTRDHAPPRSCERARHGPRLERGDGMLRTWIAITLLMVAVPRIAGADGKTESGEPTTPGEDEALYHCKKRTGQVSVTFKPETELKDLVTWAMGFTCKNFMYDPSYVQRAKKVTIMVPNTMTAHEAYRVFTSALATMGYGIVPKGDVLRIVEAPTIRTESVPFAKRLPDDGDQVVRFVYRPTYAQPTTVQ